MRKAADRFPERRPEFCYPLWYALVQLGMDAGHAFEVATYSKAPS